MEDNGLDRQELIEYIKRNMGNYKKDSFEEYSTTQLVILKVEIEIEKENPRKPLKRFIKL